LLRGINVVGNQRIGMPELRGALEADGFRDVATYLQSGNVVLSSPSSAARVAQKVNAVIQGRFGFDVAVVIRSHADLAEVVRRNPLAREADDPKRYLVTFFSSEIPRDLGTRMRAVAGPRERFVVIGREVYSWHPEGVARSPLWERLAAKMRDVVATSRNWSTVTALLAMAAR
jgi:uncharacterized protein (DUF1697 family)